MKLSHLVLGVLISSSMEVQAQSDTTKIIKAQSSGNNLSTKEMQRADSLGQAQKREKFERKRKIMDRCPTCGRG